jgi:hypothetical protein
MEARTFGFGDILGEAGALLRGHFAFLAGVTALVAAGYVVLDLATQRDASSIPSLIVGIFVQYLVVERLLAGRVTDPGNRRYGSLFLASLLSGLGMLVGLVFLIVPGLVLAAGWSAVTPFVVVDKARGLESLGASWRATAASRWQIVGAMLATYVPAIVIFVLVLAAVAGIEGGGMFDETAAEGPGSIIFTNIFAAIYSTWGCVLGAAIYNLAVPSDAGLSEVFG